MIATILHSSKSFNAVDYNERKVAKGTAELLEMKNFKYLQTMGFLTPTDLKRYLMDYSARNERIKNAQFHVAISCKGQEYTKEQLLEIAHKYLKEMGYANAGQPLLIYAHHDTDNNHIHIVTSRVAPDGHKIDHNNERVRSMEAINRIMGVDRSRETKTIIQNAFAYSFSSLGQFNAIIESSGYECYQQDDNVKVKKDGIVIDTVLLAIVQSHIKQEKKNETAKRKRQLKAILTKYCQMASDKEELRMLMKKKFGVDLIFAGSKDTPYGYHVVDHKEKAVYKGSEIMPIKSLLNFSKKEYDKSSVEDYIKSQIHANPHITLYDMNALLWRKFSLSINSKGHVLRGVKKLNLFVIDKDILSKLEMNRRIAWVQSFCPTNDKERDLLCRIFHLDKEEIAIEKEGKNSIKQKESAQHLSDIIDHTEGNVVFRQLREGGFFIVRDGEVFHAIDMRNGAIVNLSEYGINTVRLLHEERDGRQMSHQGRQQQKPQQGHHSGQTSMNLKKLLESKSNGNINREWEVGSHENWDDIDNKLKR